MPPIHDLSRRAGPEALFSLLPHAALALSLRRGDVPASPPSDIERLVRQALATVRGGAAAKGLALRAAFARGAGRRAVGDPVRLRQVLLNLLSNAIRFTDRGAVTVHVRLVACGGGPRRVRLEVADTGIGVPLEVAARLFQPFEPIDASAARQPVRTGLGLAISRELVERMDGRIGVRSQPGQGSTFWFEVPLRRPLPAGTPA